MKPERSNFWFDYKATVIEMTCSGHKDRHTDQWKRRAETVNSQVGW